LWTLQYHPLLSKRFPYAARRIGQGENMTISLSGTFKAYAEAKRAAEKPPAEPRGNTFHA
jgi:hypothetical protein